MISQVKVGTNYINISVAITDNIGKAIDPTTAEAWFYKISQIDGSLDLDTNINGDGKVTLNKQNGQTGFYGNSVSISSLLEGEYVILYKISAEMKETITVEYLSIDLSKKQVEEIKNKTDNLPINPSPVGEYDTELSNIQLDLNNPDQFKADVSNLDVAISTRSSFSVTDVANAVWDEITSGHVTNDTFGKIIQSILANQEIKNGVITDISPSKMEFNSSLTEKVDDFWSRSAIRFTSGQNEGIIRKIQYYKTLNGKIKLRTDLPYAPATNDTFTIMPLRCFRININDAIDQGNWEIKDNQMIFYTCCDGEDEIILKFNLYDKDGNPSMTNVCKRELVK